MHTTSNKMSSAQQWAGVVKNTLSIQKLLKRHWAERTHRPAQK